MGKWGGIEKGYDAVIQAKKDEESLGFTTRAEERAIKAQEMDQSLTRAKIFDLLNLPGASSATSSDTAAKNAKNVLRLKNRMNVNDFNYNEDDVKEINSWTNQVLGDGAAASNIIKTLDSLSKNSGTTLGPREIVDIFNIIDYSEGNSEIVNQEIQDIIGGKKLTPELVEQLISLGKTRTNTVVTYDFNAANQNIRTVEQDKQQVQLVNAFVNTNLITLIKNASDKLKKEEALVVKDNKVISEYINALNDLIKIRDGMRSSDSFVRDEAKQRAYGMVMTPKTVQNLLKDPAYKNIDKNPMISMFIPIRAPEANDIKFLRENPTIENIDEFREKFKIDPSVYLEK